MNKISQKNIMLKSFISEPLEKRTQYSIIPNLQQYQFNNITDLYQFVLKGQGNVKIPSIPNILPPKKALLEKKNRCIFQHDHTLEIRKISQQIQQEKVQKQRRLNRKVIVQDLITTDLTATVKKVHKHVPMRRDQSPITFEDINIFVRTVPKQSISLKVSSQNSTQEQSQQWVYQENSKNTHRN